MQNEKAKKLQEAWGDKHCDHPSFEKEYYLASATMDYVCSICGADFTREEKDKIIANKIENAIKFSEL